MGEKKEKQVFEGKGIEKAISIFSQNFFDFMKNEGGDGVE